MIALLRISFSLLFLLSSFLATPTDLTDLSDRYVEQTQRERDQSTEMHRIFQRDLCKLRLSTARSYVKMISDGQGPVCYSAGVSLRLNARVQGIVL